MSERRAPRPLLTQAALAAALRELPGWELRDGKLQRALAFADFAEAFAFMTRVAFAAERLDHHPDWSNVWNRVGITLWTHDSGGITQRDLELARAIEAAAGAAAVGTFRN
ncbi:MAG TPA: 4a-hydroxytetrahydrobiopterin dehydratase [Myxococcota bacterium]